MNMSHPCPNKTPAKHFGSHQLPRLHQQSSKGVEKASSLDSAMGGALDPSFIQDPDHRPDFNMAEANGIPTIDLSSEDGLTSLISHACQTWGFFQVINHGVPSHLRRRVEVLAKEFFDRSIEEKLKVKRDEVHPMGYHDSEHTKNVRDWKEVFDFFLQDPTLVPASCDFQDKELRELTNQWPADFPEFRSVLEEYAREVEKLAFRLLGLISSSLGLPADRFDGYFKEQTSFLRLNHYPPCPQPELALGVGRHKDGGALTVLFQDSVGGLQIQRRSNGEWISVRPVPDSYVINLGNAMQAWTNDKYWSAEHRVVANSQRERFSVPFFFFPGHQTDVKPLDELTGEQNPPLYKEFNWGKFFVMRNRSDFKKLNAENIQIEHFKASDK